MRASVRCGLRNHVSFLLAMKCCEWKVMIEVVLASLTSSLTATPIHNIITAEVRLLLKENRKRDGRKRGNEGRRKRELERDRERARERDR